MKAITQNLQKELKQHLKSADEIWVAVAMITSSGLKFIQDNVKPGTKETYAVGIDLPTDIKALQLLNKQQMIKDLKVGMVIGNGFYHPKVYLIKSAKKYIAFIGSANCTTSGLFSNIELSYIITSQNECKELLDWMQQILKISIPLNLQFIQRYESTYLERKALFKKNKELAKEAKLKTKEDYHVIMHSRKELINRLKVFKKKRSFVTEVKERKHAVSAIRKSLDYPDFKKVDIDRFFKIWDLGHLISIPKPTLKKNPEKFQKMLRVLTDESIDVAVRYSRALKGDLYIRGVGEATITKILAVHHPKRYSVINDKIERVLNEYGVEFPKGITKGERYKATNKFLVELCLEVGLEDLTILDLYLYLIANE